MKMNSCLTRSFLAFFLVGFLKAGDIVFVDVGQGNTTLVRFRDEAPLIVDSGSTQLRGEDQSARSEFKRQTIAKIRQKTESFLLPIKKSPDSYDLNIIISHAHEDHYNLIVPIFENNWMVDKKIGFLLGGKAEHYGRTGTAKKFLTVVRRYQPSPAQIFVEEFASEDILPDFGYSPQLFKIMAALKGESTDLNDYSVVLRVQVGNTGCLLTGDATGPVTEKILQRYSTEPDQLESTIYQACHHGSALYGSNEENFIHAVKPNYVIFSSGTKYNHPSALVVKRVIPHVQSDLEHHILRYYPHSDVPNTHIVDEDNTTRKVHFRSLLTNGNYVFSTTQLRIFNTQDQKTLSFQIQSGSPDLVLNHEGLVKENASEIEEKDIF